MLAKQVGHLASVQAPEPVSRHRPKSKCTTCPPRQISAVRDLGQPYCSQPQLAYLRAAHQQAGACKCDVISSKDAAAGQFTCRPSPFSTGRWDTWAMRSSMRLMIASWPRWKKVPVLVRTVLSTLLPVSESTTDDFTMEGRDCSTRRACIGIASVLANKYRANPS